jgi:hypothetical protein
VVAVAAVLATTTKYNHKANFETKGKSRQFKFLLHPAVKWAKTTLTTNPGEGPSVFSSSGVFLVVDKDQPDKERKQKREIVRTEDPRRQMTKRPRHKAHNYSANAGNTSRSFCSPLPSTVWGIVRCALFHGDLGLFKNPAGPLYTKFYFSNIVRERYLPTG